MAQAKMYQVDHLKQNIYNVFSESISILEQQRQIEQQEFIQEKMKFMEDTWIIDCLTELMLLVIY